MNLPPFPGIQRAALVAFAEIDLENRTTEEPAKAYVTKRQKRAAREAVEHITALESQISEFIKERDMWRQADCSSILLDLIRSYCKSIGGIPPGLQTKLVVGECTGDDCPLVLTDESAESFLRGAGQRTMSDRIAELEGELEGAEDRYEWLLSRCGGTAPE